MKKEKHQDQALWLKWAQEIQAQSQNTLAFAQNEYDIERGKKLAEIAAEMVEHHCDFDKEKLVHDYASQPGYATPKVDVRGVVIKDGRLLLVKEATDGKWALPGGWADVGDYPAHACEREVLEEAGLTVQAKKVIAVIDANRTGRPMELYHAFKIIFLCKTISGKIRPSFETPDVNYFDFDRLPTLSENRTNHTMLDEVRKHVNNPDRPTFFN